MNLYFKYSQTSLNDWSPIYCITNTSLNDCLSYDFLFDNEQNIHFVWSEETTTKEAIFYRMFYENTTLTPTEQLTDGTTSCLNPRIVIDKNNKINLFYGNHTVESPDFYGTKTVNSRTKELPSGEWSSIFEVAPYTPPDRPGSNRADGYAPATIMDEDEKLWLAYSMDEDYAYRTGIDIRAREDNNWQPSTRLTIIKTVTIKPHLIVDSQNNLHCFWMDYRNLVWDIFQRTKNSDGLWLPEYCITTGFTPKNNSWRFVAIFLGVAFALAIPGIVINRLRARKRKKLINKKMTELKNSLK
jgi:hypothetical protein